LEPLIGAGDKYREQTTAKGQKTTTANGGKPTTTTLMEQANNSIEDQLKLGYPVDYLQQVGYKWTGQHMVPPSGPTRMITNNHDITETDKSTNNRIIAEATSVTSDIAAVCPPSFTAGQDSSVSRSCRGPTASSVTIKMKTRSSNDVEATNDDGKRKRVKCQKCKLVLLKKNLNKHLNRCNGFPKQGCDSISGQWTSKNDGDLKFIHYDFSTHKVFGTVELSNNSFFQGGRFSSMVELLDKMDKIVPSVKGVFWDTDYWTVPRDDGIVYPNPNSTRKKKTSLRKILESDDTPSQVYCYCEMWVSDKKEWVNLLEEFSIPARYMNNKLIQKVGIFYSKGNVINEEHEDNK
jgi:hypothetical protein